MGEKAKVDERGLVPVAPLGMSGASRGVFHDADLKTLLKQIAQVRFDADVSQHPAQDDLADAALTQLQDKIVGLRTPDFLGTDSDGLSDFE